MKIKVEPKLKFDVGEEVVICGASASWCSNDHWPNENEFTFTTIKEVREDGSVVVEEGYRFKQAYKTQYGFTDVYDYFKIARQQDGVKFNNKKYYKYNYYLDARVDDVCVFFYGPIYLFKKTKVFENRMTQYEEEYKHFLIEKKQVEEAKAIKDAKEKPFKDAYKEEIEPLKEEYQRKLVKAWKEHFCKSCKHNCDNHCIKWNYNLEESSVETCSAWEVE